MSEPKKVLTLGNSGDEAFVPVKQLMVKLEWTTSVDLDLMAFYQTKDGKTGGVFSENYPNGTYGNLNAFPFMQLSGDEGVGGEGGDNQETLMVTQLDEIKEVYFVALNYTDACEGRAASFASYDGKVTVTDDKGEQVVVPLNTPQEGIVAIICKIDNSSFVGAKLVNLNKITDLADFVNTVPGARSILAQ
jgi:tellurite resistance protein TerA